MVNANQYQQDSFWLDGLAEPPALAETIPANVDVAIIGSGYTGLNAALETARGGRSTLVLDAVDPGWGCSTRNGGQISTSIKPSLDKLTAKFGAERAQAIRNEGKLSLEWIETLINRENIDCDFERVGRFHAAHTPKHYDALLKDSETLFTQEKIESFAVPRAEQHKTLGTDAYYGGVVFTRHASLHPAKYHRGLLAQALNAGTQIVGDCKVQDVLKLDKGYCLTTSKGTILARDVIIATNGYTSELTPWLQRRVIPIGSYVIATEPLPAELMDKLFPSNRIASDTCKVVYYYRPSTDRKRIIFGGRVSANETNPQVSGPRLYKDMCRIFPELRDYKITHSWCGTVAYTFDEMPHTGTHEGMHYALGYCCSGVGMASYLGMRLGQKVLGQKEGQTAFDDLPFPTRPLYYGKPWFLPAVVNWYRWKDQLERRYAHFTSPSMEID